jgi:hypothetical protein
MAINPDCDHDSNPDGNPNPDPDEQFLGTMCVYDFN